MDSEPARVRLRGQASPGSRNLPSLTLLLVAGIAASAPSLAQAINEFPLANSGLPYGITVGPDGALWFTEVDRVGRITTGGVITDYAVHGVSDPQGIVTGPDGALWLAESGASRIGRL